jgi:hypothetical protein
VLAPPLSVTRCRLPPESCPDAAPEPAQPCGGGGQRELFHVPVRLCAAVVEVS